MRFLVFGAGALGSFVGGLLSTAHEVILVGRPAHVEAIGRHGLRITGRTELTAFPRAATAVRGDEEPEVVLITTKAYDTAAAVAALEPFHARALFVSLQNGVGNAEAVARAARRVAAGVTSHGVTFVAPGHVHHAGGGPTLVGPFKGVTPGELGPLARALTAAGIATEVVADILVEIWAKAIVNAAINPITALVGAPNGVLRQRELGALAERVVAEGAAVARAAGLPLEARELVGRLRAVVEATAENRSSMLQDVERGRPTEVEAINGAIVAEARRRGLEAPLTEALLVLVRARSGGGAAGTAGASPRGRAPHRP